MRKTIYGLAFCGILLVGCDAFDRALDGGPSPVEIGFSSGAQRFTENVGGGTPYELIYAAIAAVVGGTTAGYAAYKRGHKKGLHTPVPEEK